MYVYMYNPELILNPWSVFGDVTTVNLMGKRKFTIILPRDFYPLKLYTIIILYIIILSTTVCSLRILYSVRSITYNACLLVSVIFFSGTY